MKTGSSSFLHALKHGYCFKAGLEPLVFADQAFDHDKRSWVAIKRESRGADVWLSGHSTVWLDPSQSDAGEELQESNVRIGARERQRLSSMDKMILQTPPSQRVWVTFFRSPDVWLRSYYTHGGGQTTGFIEHAMGRGLQMLGDHYLMMLPVHLAAPFYDLKNKFVGGLPVYDKQLRKEVYNQTVPPTRAPYDATATFMTNVDFDAIECHLRQNMFTLLTEFMETSLALLSFTLYGDTKCLLSEKGAPVVNKAPKWGKKVAIAENIPSLLADMKNLAPMLAPYQAVYGIALRVFSRTMREAKLVGETFEEQTDKKS
jgi:hypothetical protein